MDFFKKKMRKRVKININNIDLNDPICFYNKTKEHVGMGKSPYIGGRKYHYDYEDMKRVTSAIDGIIKQSIGKPFGQAYSKFIKKYAIGSKKQDYIRWFKNKFKTWSIIYHGKDYSEYVIDNNGCIQVNTNSNLNDFRLARKYIPVKWKWDKSNFPISNMLYNFLDYIFNSPYVKVNIGEILYEELSSEDAKRINSEIEKHQFTRFPNCNYNNIRDMLFKYHWRNWFKEVDYTLKPIKTKKEKGIDKAITKQKNFLYKKKKKEKSFEMALKALDDLRINKRELRLNKEEAIKSDKELLIKNNIDIERLGFDKKTSFRTPQKFIS